MYSLYYIPWIWPKELSFPMYANFIKKNTRVIHKKIELKTLKKLKKL